MHDTLVLFLVEALALVCVWLGLALCVTGPFSLPLMMPPYYSISLLTAPQATTDSNYSAMYAFLHYILVMLCLCNATLRTLSIYIASSSRHSTQASEGIFLELSL